MKATKALLLGLPVIALGVSWAARHASTEPVESRIVRIAELEIDPNHLGEYKAALTEEIETSLRVEPGVITLLAVSVKGHPDQVRLFETYASAAAYQSHLQTPHFKKYKSETQTMVKSLTLIETEPILLGSKHR